MQMHAGKTVLHSELSKTGIIKDLI
jgi:hypothetical protein